MAVLASLGAVVVLGTGASSPAADLGGGSAWFPTVSTGALSLIDGATADRVTSVGGVAAPGADVDVEQTDRAALVLDRDTGTVTRVDDATWTVGAPLPVSAPGDHQALVRANGGAAWVISQAATVVQQLNPRSMVLSAAASSLPSPVVDATVDDAGRLWAVEQSGTIHSYADGVETSSTPGAAPGHEALALVGGRPVEVDLSRSRGVALDDRTGAPGREICLGAPVDPPPLVGGSGADASWLFAVAPDAGTLIVADADSGQCLTTVPLGPPGSARYGRPVERGRLIFVPDLVAGQVIVVDPTVTAGSPIRSQVDVGLPNAKVALLVSANHVWFDQTDGDRAGVIREDLRVLTVSKLGGEGNGRPVGAAADPGPGAAPAVGSAGQPTVAPNGTGGAPPNGPASANQSATQASSSALPSPPPGDGTPPPPPPAGDASASLPTPPPSDATGSPPTDSSPPDPLPTDPPPTTNHDAGVDFTGPSSAAPGEAVTFSATVPEGYTVTGWTAQDGSPTAQDTAAVSFTTSFATPNQTDEIVLTESNPAGRAVPVRHTIQITGSTAPQSLAPVTLAGTFSCSAGAATVTWTATNTTGGTVELFTPMVTASASTGLTSPTVQVASTVLGPVLSATAHTTITFGPSTIPGAGTITLSVESIPSNVRQGVLIRPAVVTSQVTVSACVPFTRPTLPIQIQPTPPIVDPGPNPDPGPINPKNPLGPGGGLGPNPVTPGGPGGF
jgi:hypothetical protein